MVFHGLDVKLIVLSWDIADVNMLLCPWQNTTEY